MTGTEPDRGPRQVLARSLPKITTSKESVSEVVTTKPRQRVILLLALVPPLAALVWFGWTRIHQARIRAAMVEAEWERPTNILLLGLDARGGKLNEQRSDVIIIAACDPGRNRIKLLSIPRDTLVEIPGHGTDRINSAYMYGKLGLTREMVGKLTGLAIDRYVQVDFRAFQELVDILGGIEVDVDKRMYYQDKKQGLLIDLQKGRQVLNGRQAMGFVRYRHDPMGDLTRIQRQQQVIRAVLNKAIEENLWMKLIPLYRLQRKYIRTDLTLVDLYRLRNFGRNLADQSALSAFTVPGDFSGPYWQADSAALAALIAKEFQPASPAPPKEEPKAAPVPQRKKEDK